MQAAQERNQQHHSRPESHVQLAAVIAALAAMQPELYVWQMRSRPGCLPHSTRHCRLQVPQQDLVRLQVTQSWRAQGMLRPLQPLAGGQPAC